MSYCYDHTTVGCTKLSDFTARLGNVVYRVYTYKTWIYLETLPNEGERTIKESPQAHIGPVGYVFGPFRIFADRRSEGMIAIVELNGEWMFDSGYYSEDDFADTTVLEPENIARFLAAAEEFFGTIPESFVSLVRGIKVH